MNRLFPRIRILTVSALALGFSAAPQARAFDLSLVGDLNFSTPHVEVAGSTSTGLSSKNEFGGGLLLNFDLTPATQLELGALYVGRRYTYPISSGSAEDSFHTYEFPVLLRVLPFRVFSLGAGGYYALPSGQYTYTVTPTGQTGTSTSSEAANSFKNDFGLVGSVAIRIPLNFAISFLMDGRYYYGLMNASKIEGESLKFRDAQVLFGVNFGF